MTHKILLVISGSVAAYKSLELIRLLKRENLDVSAILTEGGAQFITPLAVSSLTGTPTYSELFSLKDEVEMGHIRLSRTHDLIVVAPASADFIAKMAAGRADDLASATLLASNIPVIVAPAMNHQMWEHPATRRNLALLQTDGVTLIPPAEGEMACGEYGQGRLVEPQVIVDHIKLKLMGKASRSLPLVQKASETQAAATLQSKPLAGRRVLVTSGPTQEAIDPVRFISNQSSGKQGHAIAHALKEAGADVILISGPVNEPTPDGVTVVRVTSAEQMYQAVMRNLPVDIAVCAAAVADWTVSQPAHEKIKKGKKQIPQLVFSQTKDILAALSQHPTTRPSLVVGFAAETESVIENALSKRHAKGCDWLIANDVSGGYIFGSDTTQLTFIDAQGVQRWQPMTKLEAARELTRRIVAKFTFSPHSVVTQTGRKTQQKKAPVIVPQTAIHLDALSTKSAQARVLAAQGMAKADIARKLGITYALVAAALKPTKRKQHMAEIETGLAMAVTQEAKVRFLASKGYKPAKIARTLSLALEDVKKMRKSRGKAKKRTALQKPRLITNTMGSKGKPAQDARFRNQSEHIRHLADIGMSRAEIAKLLGIRYQTVRNALVMSPTNYTPPAQSSTP